MKVKLDAKGWTEIALRERIQWQGDEIVMNGEDVIVRGSQFDPIKLPDMTAEALLGHSLQLQNPDPWYLVKVFDSESFLGQTIQLLPLLGSHGESLGFPCSMGGIARFVRSVSSLELERVCDFLKEMKYKGFVCIEMNQDQATSLLLGVPHFAGLALMERWPGKISEFELNPSSFSFRESWCVATILSSWPYPFNCEETSKGVTVEGVNPEIEKHFWSFAPKGVKGGRFVSKDCVLGVATAWDPDPSRLAWRVENTCRNIIAPMKQYRLDLARTIRMKVEAVEQWMV